MIKAIVATTVSVLTGLSAVHYLWARQPRLLNTELVVPYSAGRPLFRPGQKSCRALSLLLLGMAAVLSVAGFRLIPSASKFFKSTAFFISTLFALRSVGDFRYIGFFKRKRKSKFARLDTALYSPLCALIAIGALLAALPDRKSR